MSQLQLKHAHFGCSNWANDGKIGMGQNRLLLYYHIITILGGISITKPIYFRKPSGSGPMLLTVTESGKCAIWVLRHVG